MRTAIEIGRPVRVEQGATLAAEAFRHAAPALRTPEDIHLAAPDDLLFPAGTPVRRAWLSTSGSTGEYRPCLPEFPALRSRYRTGLRVVPCLADGDGDGLYERVERWTYQPGMHVIITGHANDIDLPRPLRLAADPAGDPRSCRDAERRLKVAGVEGGTAWISVFSTESDCGADTPYSAPVFTDRPDGGRVYQLAPPAPPLAARTTGAFIRNLATPTRETVALVDGARVTVGGLSLRIARAGKGWTMTPLDAAFPRWLPRTCD